jgi:hypothetical protein
VKLLLNPLLPNSAKILDELKIAEHNSEGALTRNLGLLGEA